MQRNKAIERHVLIFDGDCAFCTLWVTRLREWLPVFPTALTSQSIDKDAYGLSDDDLARFAWYITPSHQYAGHLATSALLRAQPKLWLRILGAVLAAWPVSWLAAGVYHLIAKYRHKLPGGTPACEPAQVS